MFPLLNIVYLWSIEDKSLIYVETDKDIRKHRFWEKKDADENIFESLNELQKIKV